MTRTEAREAVRKAAERHGFGTGKVVGWSGFPEIISGELNFTLTTEATENTNWREGRIEENVYADAETFLEWERTHKGDMTDYTTSHKDLLDAGSRPITLRPGAANFDIIMSFTMPRGGHLDKTILGAMQVSEKGDLANWLVPGQKATGMGGAMDIVAGTKEVIIATTLTAKDGSAKLVRECTLPLTAVGVVTTVVTEKCIVDVTEDGFLVKALFPGVTKEEVAEAIDADVTFAKDMGVMVE